MADTDDPAAKRAPPAEGQEQAIGAAPAKRRKDANKDEVKESTFASVRLPRSCANPVITSCAHPKPQASSSSSPSPLPPDPHPFLFVLPPFLPLLLPTPFVSLPLASSLSFQ